MSHVPSNSPEDIAEQIRKVLHDKNPNVIGKGKAFIPDIEKALSMSPALEFGYEPFEHVEFMGWEQDYFHYWEPYDKVGWLCIYGDKHYGNYTIQWVKEKEE